MQSVHTEILETLPSYTEVELALLRTKAAIDAGEVHGLLCGFICAGKDIDGRSWLDSVLGHLDMDDAGAKECRALLIELYAVSDQKLKDMAFDFQLLLPDDEQPLSKRAAALGEWCQGFMAGLGLAGLEAGSVQSEDCQDALYHFSEISRLDYETLEIAEDDERSYVEVVEYVRMAVLMIYTELADNCKRNLH